MKVVLSSDVPHAKIYYTVDGSEPTETSARYEQPVTLAKSATVRAVAWLGSTPRFPVAEAEFTGFTGATLTAAEEVSRGLLEKGLTYSYYEGGWRIVCTRSRCSISMRVATRG